MTLDQRIKKCQELKDAEMHPEVCEGIEMHLRSRGLLSERIEKHINEIIIDYISETGMIDLDMICRYFKHHSQARMFWNELTKFKSIKY